MTSKFKKAERKNINIRMALCGPTGSGKTYTALGLATTIAKELGGRVALIDTERSSSDRYADKFDFDQCQLDTFAPEDYMAAINEAADAGYPVIVIDSLSHAWDGQDGLLERVETIAARSKSGSTFNAWSQATPVQRRMIDCILSFPGHVFVTMRSKMEFVQEKGENGKTVIKKVGMAPVQRQGIEYEFDIVGDMDQEHYLILTKSRAAELADKCFPKPGKKFALDVLAWARGSADATPRTETKEPAKTEPPAPPKETNPIENKEPAKRDPSKIPVTECPRCGGGKNPTAHLCPGCDSKDEAEACTKAAEKPLRFFTCGKCYATATVRDLPKKCEKCGSGSLTESKTLKEAQEKALILQKEVEDAKKAEEAKAATPPVQAKPAADLGKDIAAKLTEINRLIISVTGAKNRGEVLEEASELVGRKISGLAQLAGAEADEILEALNLAAQMKEEDPASIDAFLSNYKAATASKAQGVSA